MASTIQLKTGTGSAVPSSLTQGEVAINIDNGLVYYGSGSGNTVKKLESFTNITASGNIRAASMTIGTGTVYDTNLNLANDGKIRIGNAEYIDKDGNDLNLFQGKLKIHHVGDGATFAGPITASKSISASSFITDGHITASGNISSSRTITGLSGSFDYVKTNKLQVGAAGGTDILSIDGGDLQLENGKQITFADIGDSNTGRVRIVGNEDSDIIQMFVDNNNSHTLRLDTTGVSIGTSTPAEKLTVAGNISASGTINGSRLSQAGTLINDTFAPVTGHANIVTVGALNAGSITSGFTSIDVGSGAIKTTGILLGGNITGSNISASGTISGSKGHFVDGLTLGTRLNANQIGANGNVGNTEYGYLNGVTSAIQTQFDAKAPTANPSFTGTASFASHITASGNISASGEITALSASIAGPIRGKQIDIVQAHFKGATGTSLYYLPIAGVPDEQTAPHKEGTVMIAPCSGRLLRAIVRADLDLSGENCVMTLVVRPKNKILNGGKVDKEAVTFTGPDSTNNEDANTVLVPFTNAASFVYGDAIGVNIQFQSTGMTDSADRFWCTLVFEYDFETLGY